MLRNSRRERGAVLATGLIVLVVMTLLVLSMLKTSVVELKVGGIKQTSEQNFSNADTALVKFINDNNGRFTKGCVTAAPGPDSCFCTSGNTAACQADDNVYKTKLAGGAIVVGDSSLSFDDQPLFGAQETRITAVELTDCIEAAQRGSGNQLSNSGAVTLRQLYFDITATSKGWLSGQSTVHQGIESYCK